MISSTQRSSKMPWDLFIVGMILLGIYFVLVWAHRNFGLADFNYLSNPGAFMTNIPTPFIRSQFWKIVVLFPATILFSVSLARAGFRFRLPAAMNEHLAIGSVLLIAATVLVLLTQFLFRETEVTDDENTYDFQAQTLLLGRVVNPPPPVVKSFENVFIINDGKQWIGKYNLGHPLVIALGMVLGSRYVLTISFSVLTLLLIYLISLRLYGDKRVAFLTLLLGGISPFFYLVSSSRLSHTTTAFFLALFMYLFLESRCTGEKTRRGAVLAFLSGIALGYAFNVRSLTALGFAIPFCFIGIMDLRQRKMGTASKGLLFAAGFLLMVIITLWYNAIVTGSAFKFPFHYYDMQESLGFSVQGHSLLRALRNLAISTGRLNGAFLGLPLSLLFPFLVLFAKKGFGDYLSIGILGGIAIAYLFYYSPGVSDLGPVYYYEGMIPLLILSSRGIVFVHRFVADHIEQGNALVPNFLVLSVILSLVTFVPEQINHVSGLTEQIRQPYETVRSANVHNALVLIQSWPKKGWVFGYRNPSPQLTDDVVFALYADTASNLALVRYLRDRTPYVFREDTVMGSYEAVPVDRATLQPLPSR